MIKNTNNEPDTWQNRIKERLKFLRMTQEELARKMGVTRSAITHYLAGRRMPTLSQFEKIAKALDTNPSWLQFGDHHKSLIENAPPSIYSPCTSFILGTSNQFSRTKKNRPQ